MNCEKFFLYCFYTFFTWFLAGPFIWAEKSMMFHLIIDYHMITLFGMGNVMFFILRWRRNLPTPVTWLQLARTCWVFGTSIHTLGAVLMIHDLLKSREVFMDIGWVFIWLSVPFLIKGMRFVFKRK